MTPKNNQINPNDRNEAQSFDPSKIRMDTRKLTVEFVLKKIDYDTIYSIGDFQSNKIWTDIVKSLLIESLLIRVPLPTFCVEVTDCNRWLVVDGVKRLNVLKEFIIDRSFKLTRLQYLSELENLSYDQLHRKYQRRILETELTVFIIEPGIPPTIKDNIFQRMNSSARHLYT